MRKLIPSLFLILAIAVLAVASDESIRPVGSMGDVTSYTLITTIPYKSIQIYVYAPKTNDFQDSRRWSFYYAPIMQPKTVKTVKKDLRVTLMVGNKEIDRIVLEEVKKKFPPLANRNANSWSVSPLMIDSVVAYIVKDPESPVKGVTMFRMVNPKGLDMDLRFTCANQKTAEEIKNKLLEGTLEIEMIFQFAGMGRAEGNFPAITATNLRDVARRTVVDGGNGKAKYIYRHHGKRLIATYLANVKRLILTGSRKNMLNVADLERELNMMFQPGLDQSHPILLGADDFRQIWSSEHFNRRVLESKINKRFQLNKTESKQRRKIILQINRQNFSSHSGVFPFLASPGHQNAENSKGHISISELKRILAEDDIIVKWTLGKIEVESFRVFRLTDLIAHLEVALITKQLLADKRPGSITHSVSLMDPVDTDSEERNSNVDPVQLQFFKPNRVSRKSNSSRESEDPDTKPETEPRNVLQRQRSRMRDILQRLKESK